MRRRFAITRLKRDRHPHKLRRQLRAATKTIERLNDENQSLWFLLNEMRESEIEKHGDLLREEIQDVIDKTQILVQTKTGEA